MTTVTVTIRDTGDTVEFEGALDNPEALNQPPTAALIIGSYLAANAEGVLKDSMAWFKAMQLAPAEDPKVQANTQLIVP